VSLLSFVHVESSHGLLQGQADQIEAIRALRTLRNVYQGHIKEARIANIDQIVDDVRDSLATILGDGILPELEVRIQAVLKLPISEGDMAGRVAEVQAQWALIAEAEKVRGDEYKDEFYDLLGVDPGSQSCDAEDRRRLKEEKRQREQREREEVERERDAALLKSRTRGRRAAMKNEVTTRVGVWRGDPASEPASSTMGGTSEAPWTAEEEEWIVRKVGVKIEALGGGGGKGGCGGGGAVGGEGVRGGGVGGGDGGEEKKYGGDLGVIGEGSDEGEGKSRGGEQWWVMRQWWLIRNGRIGSGLTDWC
jgi:hypothetical protein